MITIIVIIELDALACSLHPGGFRKELANMQDSPVSTKIMVHHALAQQHFCFGYDSDLNYWRSK